MPLLSNRPGNQLKPSGVGNQKPSINNGNKVPINGKPTNNFKFNKPMVKPKGLLLPTVPEKKALGQPPNKVKIAAPLAKPPLPVVPKAIVTKVPLLSTLRENVQSSSSSSGDIHPTAKRHKVVEEIVRTAGKEIGFLKCRDRPDAVPDIYAGDISDEALVVPYVEHIYEYLYQREILIRRHYMDTMSVNPRMRSILVDWVVSVTYKFKMCQDTLFLAVNIMDRFMSIPEFDLTREDLQLIGVTAMFIAGKFEEVYPPDLEDYVFISDNGCSREEIVEMEMTIASALDFDFTRPLVSHFIRRCCKAAKATAEEYNSAKYIAELAMLDYEFAGVRSSLVAAGSMYLATLQWRGPGNIWDEQMHFYSRYEESLVKRVAYRLFELVKSAPQSRFQCTVKKYSSNKNYQVSSIVEAKLDEMAAFFQTK